MLGVVDVKFEADGILLTFSNQSKIHFESFFIISNILIHYLPKTVNIF